eukprot:TRINITY_DN1180_c0_g1_i1.p1 TRINITY_DN1180_c0_g1~~TRINITY_DN1180_c0_g1_i1.p1  ORF type:complete len:440 (+),score=84.96 TRINITY_DN1180_c0_g1_i1:32-1321(+)
MDTEASRRRAAKQIAVVGKRVPPPVLTIREAGFPPELVSALTAKGITDPTPIQCQAWPTLLAGRDVIALAETGTGKTLAFALPAIVRALASPPLAPGDGPLVLVIAPTRELVLQIGAVFSELCVATDLGTLCAYGGTDKTGQSAALSTGATHILVATPGRLLELLDRKKTSLSQTCVVVLDEADKMLAMGFEADVRRIISLLAGPHQTAMFAATWTESVHWLAFAMMREPVQIAVGRAGAGLLPSQFVTHRFRRCGSVADKIPVLIDILCDVMDGSQILVFASTKHGVDSVVRALRLDGWPALGIHGDKEQLEREWVLHEFTCGRCPILVGTDLASRGLDIPAVRIVINYDLPSSPEIYTHRTGRTGRAGVQGLAITLLPATETVSAELIQLLADLGQHEALAEISGPPPRVSSSSLAAEPPSKQARYR